MRSARNSRSPHWYDSFDALSRIADAAPGEPCAAAQRASLLEQVGLREVAAQLGARLTRRARSDLGRVLQAAQRAAAECRPRDPIAGRRPTVPSSERKRRRRDEMSAASKADSRRETPNRNYRIVEEACRLLAPLLLLGLAVAVADWVSAPPEVGSAMTEPAEERVGLAAIERTLASQLPRPAFTADAR